MVDILANGEHGRDDGVKCDKCGSSTFLVDNQGGGLLAYDCNDDKGIGCDGTIQVQYESGDEDEEPPDPEYDPAWDDDIDQIEFNQPEDSILLD